MEILAYKLSGLVVAFSLLTPVPKVFAQQTPSLQIKSFSLGPDITVTYPDSPSGANQLAGLADEHTTFFPPVASGAPYLVFGAASASVSSGVWGGVVLQTTDLKTFAFAPGYNFPVLTSPVTFTKCNPSHDTDFDENYAAPGSVLQDPTMPAGNLIMIYGSEQHCPGGVWQAPFYGSVGFARSSDNGKTWPAPQGGMLGGPSRHAILQSPEPQPTIPHGFLGDVTPSAFVDKSASGDYYLYVTYIYFSAGQALRVARAKLGTDPLTFLKWYNGSFSQPSIGGKDSDVMPSTGCGSRQLRGPEISYNDDLGLYLMIFTCYSDPVDGAQVAGWYYSTATSLDLQDWTAPQLIQNSQFPLVPCTQGSQQDFDGHYPSTLSPGAAAGHTKLTGYMFFSHITCDLATRQFLSRTFTIVAEPDLPEISLVANAFGNNLPIAPNTWVKILGSNLAPAGDTRVWQGSDFVNNQMPTQLNGVSATANGKSAYVEYISPTQVNILTPPDAMQGPVNVVLMNNGTPSAAFTAQAQPLSPSFFVFDGTHVVGQHLDGTDIGPTTLYPGLTTPAKPNEIVVLYANGFGPTSTPVVSGSPVQSGSLPALPLVKIGGITAMVQFAGLSYYPGEFQLNVVVPPNTPDGDQRITATYNGLTTQAGALITIQH